MLFGAFVAVDPKYYPKVGSADKLTTDYQMDIHSTTRLASLFCAISRRQEFVLVLQLGGQSHYANSLLLFDLRYQMCWHLLPRQ
jgi:hypothetical protein